MNIFVSVFEAVAIMFGIGIIGFAIIHRKMVEADVFSLMVPLVVEIALPCLIFYNIITKFNPENFTKLWQLPLYWIIETFFFLILSILLSQIAKREIKKEFLVSLFYQNGIFFPIIIFSQLYGNKSIHLVNLFIFTMFYPSFFFNTISFFFTKRFNRKNLINLVLIATILGILIKTAHMDQFFPEFLFKIFEKVGAMTIPLLMIIIGGNIYIDLQKKIKFEILENIKFVVIKNFIFPSVTMLLLYIMKLKGDLALLLFLESAVPPITAIPIFIHRAGGNSSIANQFLISSFIVSLISIPLMFAIFNSIIGI